MSNFFKDKCILIIKTLFLVIFITNLSYARDESSAITWTHLLPEGVFDFIPEGGVTDEMWRDNEFLEEKYFTKQNYRKIRKKLLVDIASARIDEIANINRW